MIFLFFFLLSHVFLLLEFFSLLLSHAALRLSPPSFSTCSRTFITSYHHPSGSWAAGTEYISRLAPSGMKSTAQSLFSAAYAGVGAGAGALVAGSLYTSHGSDACFQGTAAAVVAAWLCLSVLETVAGGGVGEEEEREGQGAGAEENKMGAAFFLDDGSSGGGDNSSPPPLARGARAPRPCTAIAGNKEHDDQKQQHQYQQQKRGRLTSGGSPARRLRAPVGSPPRSPASGAKRRTGL